jgi:hypothetical protein
MSEQKPITRNSLGRRLWQGACSLMGLLSGIRLRSETLMVIATCFSAIAAGGSLWAALQQEKATYLSQLYTKQIELIGPFYPQFAPFYKELRSLAWRKDAGSPSNLSAFGDRVSKLHDFLETQRGFLLVTFPIGVTVLSDEMEEELGDIGQAVQKYDDADGRKALYRAWERFRDPYEKLTDCVRTPLQSGHAIVYPMCN